MADGPVIAGAIDLGGLELEIAQAKRLPRPEERSPAEQAHAHPVVGLRGVVRVGVFLFVHPLVRVELVGLIDVAQAARFVEAAPGQFMRRFGDTVLLVVGFGAGVEHQAGDALFGQDTGSHAAGVAGTHNQNVVFFLSHAQSAP